MKAILMSIKPKYVAKILNGEKTIEIRKRFPKDYKGWVYIYCTKNGDRPIYLPWEFDCHIEDGKFVVDCDFEKGNGKVVARFWCDEIYTYDIEDKNTLNDKSFEETTKKLMCLSLKELRNYVGNKIFFGIHISKLEIFDKPKELKEFKQPRNSYGKVDFKSQDIYLSSIEKAPQSRQYVVVEK